MNQIKHLARRKSSGIKNLKDKTLNWSNKNSSSLTQNLTVGLPGDSKRADGAVSKRHHSSKTQAVLSAAAEEKSVNTNDALHLVALYLSQLGYNRELATKVLHKFKKFGLSQEDSICAQYQKFREHQDAACIEEFIMSVLPEKNRIACLRFLYGRLLRYNDFFRTLTRAVPEEELILFEAKLLQSLRRENIFPNRYLAVAPRGAVYIVRRGSVRISMKGTVVATLHKGAVFEVCVLSSHYVTIHHLNENASARMLGIHTNSAFDVIESSTDGGEGKNKKKSAGSHDTASGRAKALIEGQRQDFDEADDEDDEDDDGYDPEQDRAFGSSAFFRPTARLLQHHDSGSSSRGPQHSSGRTTSTGTDSDRNEDILDEEEAVAGTDDSASTNSADAPGNVQSNSSNSSNGANSHALSAGTSPGRYMSNRRRSLANAFGLRMRYGENNHHQQQQHEANERGHRVPVHPADRRRSLAIKADRDVQTYPFNSVNICAVEQEANLDNLLPIDPNPAISTSYPHGCELGVLTYDTLRSLVTEFPGIARNFEVLQVSVEVQVEKEAEELRRKQELTRRKLELEHRQATNRELERACRAGSVQRVHEAVVAGASFMEPLDDSGATALHLAAIFGHSEVVSLLLRLGANPCVKDRDDRTPLHLCCLVGAWDPITCKKLVRLLSQHNSCLQERDKWGNTPVHLAASTGDQILLTIFMEELARKSDTSSVLTLRNDDGFTALELCSSIDSRRILKPKTHIVANVR